MLLQGRGVPVLLQGAGFRVLLQGRGACWREPEGVVLRGRWLRLPPFSPAQPPWDGTTFPWSMVVTWL